MTKQEAIEKAWGHLWDIVKDRVNAEGCITISESNYEDQKYHYSNLGLKFGEVHTMQFPYGLTWTLNSLSGLHNNNGWRIVSKDKPFFSPANIDLCANGKIDYNVVYAEDGYELMKVMWTHWRYHKPEVYPLFDE